MKNFIMSSSEMSSSSTLGASIVKVKDELIESVQFFVPRPLLFRWDTGPFVLYYAILFSIPWIQHTYGTAFSYSFESNRPTTGLTIFCETQILSFLVSLLLLLILQRMILKKLFCSVRLFLFQSACCFTLPYSFSRKPIHHFKYLSEMWQPHRLGH